MRLSRIYSVGGCVLIVCVHLVSSTVLTATMLSSFMGGFLMGKVTLGTFLMVMQGINNGQQRNPAKTREGDGESVVIDTDSKMSEIENQIRDKFLRQLGEMDPLNCLPKVFCELSSPSKLTKLTKVKLAEEAEDDEEKDTENSEEDDETSDSEEGNEEEGPNFRIEDRKKKQILKLEADTLDELINESSDPSDLYFILKDKMKLRPKYNRYTASHPPFWPKKGIMKKHGRPNHSDASEYKSAHTNIEANNKNIDDVFADDPFFDDFARSMKLFPETVDYRRVGRQLRRIEHETGDFRRKFRVAATVGEKSTKSCQHVFNTCPFEANQIMAMVNTLKRKNAGERISSPQKSTTATKKNEKTKVKDPASLNETIKSNLQNLRNTLLAIESINNATRLAENAGMSVTYKQILENVIENGDFDPNAVSSKIVEDFNKETDKMSTTISSIINEEEKKIDETSQRRKKSNKNQKTNTSEPKTKDSNSKANNNNKYRIKRKKTKQTNTFAKRSARMSRSSKNSESSSEESPEMGFDVHPVVVKLQIPVPPTKLASNSTSAMNNATILPNTETEQDDADLRRYLSREEFEDDELNASDQDNLYIPEFSKFQSYTRRPLIRPQQNPENIPVVSVNGRPVLAATPSKPIASTNKMPISEAVLLPIAQFSPPPKKPSMEKPPRQKFTHLVEDDELDASESDKAVEKIIATRHQIKPIKPVFRT